MILDKVCESNENLVDRLIDEIVDNVPTNWRDLWLWVCIYKQPSSAHKSLCKMPRKLEKNNVHLLCERKQHHQLKCDELSSYGDWRILSRLNWTLSIPKKNERVPRMTAQYALFCSPLNKLVSMMSSAKIIRQKQRCDIYTLCYHHKNCTQQPWKTWLNVYAIWLCKFQTSNSINTKKDAYRN